jgi:hypothetical protein
MRQLDVVKNNLDLVEKILMYYNDVALAHADLDRLINTTSIFYESKDDFLKNFPDQDDLMGKVKLIVDRRK